VKKLILYLFSAILLPNSVLGLATTCVPNAVFWNILIPENAGTGHTTSNGYWQTTFGYNTAGYNEQTINYIRGQSACSIVAGTANSPDGAPALSMGDTGSSCWCKMTAPLVSSWIFINTYASDSACASSCADACGTAAQTSQAFRTAVYNNIW